jgi:hypothetical protein
LLRVAEKAEVYRRRDAQARQEMEGRRHA